MPPPLQSAPSNKANRMTILGIRASVATAILLISGVAAAPTAVQSEPDGRAALLRKLTDCRGIAADVERLACYDAATAEIDRAEAKGDIVVVDREQARAVRRQTFGFTLPSLSLLDRSGAEGDMDTVTLRVESATPLPDGKWLLRLEGGQVWRQIDTTVLSRSPRAGGSVTIKRAMMGSYKLSTGGGAAIRVHREN